MGDKTQWIAKKIDKFVVVNKKLGEGAFGTVFRGFFEEDEKQLVAVKQISLQGMTNYDDNMRLIKREITNLQKLDSKCTFQFKKNNLFFHLKIQNLVKITDIVKLHEVSRTPNNLYLFLEYCMDGDLKEYLKKKKKNGMLSEPEAIRFFKHISEGFKELQKHSIIHRDIKPANIMLSEGRAKISDFGFSRQLESDSQQNLTLLGTPLYMSPQILEGTKFSSKCDVWSVGILFYEMLYGQTPWKGESQICLLTNIKEKPLTFPQQPFRTDKVKNIITHMLELDENNRISWQDIFNNDLIVGDKKMLEESVRLIDSNTDSLEKSMIENSAYIQTNLVVNYLENVEEEGETDQRLTKEECDQTVTKQGEIMNQENMQRQTIVEAKKYENEQKVETLVKAQISDEKLQIKLTKVNDYIVYERNVSFFCNYVIQKIIKSFDSNVLEISQDLYFRVIFAISKWQNINLDKIIKMMKSSTSDFEEQVWKKYKNSLKFTKTSKSIAQDINHSKKFYNELCKKTLEIITTAIQKDSTQDSACNFKLIINDDFTSNVHFKNIYKNVLTEFLNPLKLLTSSTCQKDILIISRYILICVNPYNEFNNPEFDFNKFYEEIDNSSIEQLRKDVSSKINLVL